MGTWGQVRVEPLPTGRWRARARYRDTDGRTRDVERSGATKGAARAALAEAMAVRTSPEGDDLTANSRLALVAEVWLAEAGPKLAPASRNRYRTILDTYVLPGVGQLLVREATVGRLDRFVRTIADTKGPPTAKLCRSVLSGLMSTAVRLGAAERNPMRDVAGVTVEHAEVQALTLEQVATLRRGFAAWQRGRRAGVGGRPRTQNMVDLVDVLLGTGARIGEVLALRWQDVDLAAAQVTIAGTITHDEQGRLFRQDFPKTKGSRQTLSVPVFTLEALERLQAASRPTALDLVFPSSNGTPRDASAVRGPWRQVVTEAGLPWVTPHTVRKTVATLLEAQQGLEAAAAQLGHSGTAVTARHYVQRRKVAPDMRAVLEALAPRDALEGD